MPRFASEPFALFDKVTVTVSVWPKSASLFDTLLNGVIVALSVVLWPGVVAAINGASFAAGAPTVVVEWLLVPPAVSVALMVNVVVTDAPGTT